MCDQDGPENHASGAAAWRHVETLLARYGGGKADHAAAGDRFSSVGIIGGGTMGIGIAAAHLRQGVPVVVVDADPRVVAAAAERTAAELAHDMDPERAQALVDALLQATDDLAAVGACELVVESIDENRDVKHRLYATLEGQLAPEAVLGSNTSSIPIGKLALPLKNPRRFLGVHFFHPVRRRPLVELIRGERTDEAAVARAAAHLRAIGRASIVVEDGPGFLVNRVLLPYFVEALELLLEGATIDQVDQAALAFGMAKGPLRLADEVGLDTVVRSGVVLATAFPDRVVSSPLPVTLVKAKRLGVKSGKGFFRYTTSSDGRLRAHPDPDIDPLIARWAGDAREHTPESIANRLIVPMLLEAARVLEEGKISGPAEVDVGTLLGLGFPKDKGGLLFWADSLSRDELAERIRCLEPLGARAEPPALLREMLRDGRKFYPTT